MARFSKEEQTQLISQAKMLYIKGFTPESISSILKVSVATIARWIREHDFDKAKKSQTIALSEIRASILESYADLLDGKKPKIKPDEAVKYAAAFEKLSDKKAKLTYAYDIFETLTDAFMLKIQYSKTKAEKERLLTILQKDVRPIMDEVINKLNNEVLGHD